MTEEYKDIPGGIEDLRSAKKFWDEFNIKLPEGAHEWVEAKLAEENPTLTYKDKLRIQYYLAYGQCDTEAEVFQDALFNKAIENSKKIVYDTQFENDIEKEFSNDGDEKQDT